MILPNVQHRRGGKALERLPPECLCLRQILLLQPGDVVPIGAAHFQVQLPTCAECVIHLEDFLQEYRQRPSIQQQVMQGPDKLIGVLGQLDKGQTHQRCFGQFKALRSIFSKESLELPFLLDRGHTPPVVLPPREFYMPIDNLKRLITKLPIEGSAQNWVPIHHALPGSLEGRDVQIAMQGAAPLRAIHPWLRGIQRVKEYALLHRRKGIDILNVLSTPLRQLLFEEPMLDWRAGDRTGHRTLVPPGWLGASPLPLPIRQSSGAETGAWG